MIEINQIKNIPIDSNCYVIFDNTLGKECIIIDPGSEYNERLLTFLLENRLIPIFVFLTHEHFDHCWGVNGLRVRYPQIQLICSNECSQAIQSKKRNQSVFYEQPGFELEEADITLNETDGTLNWGEKEIHLIPVYGHTSAGIIIKCDSFLFTGDELIKDIKTVTKLKTGSKERLKESVVLFEKLKGKGFIVCPGHGDMFELDSYDINKVFG